MPPTPAAAPSLTGEGVGEGDEGRNALWRCKVAGIRLYHMNVPPTLLRHLLAGLVAQRLAEVHDIDGFELQGGRTGRWLLRS
jgi:hypothetical protein